MVVLSYGMPAATFAAPLSHGQFAALASRCAPAVPVEMLEAVARTESGLGPWALHDNTTGQAEQADSVERAAAEARLWLGRGDSVDIGLMQINSGNLPALDMTVATALDPCASLAGGAAVLRAVYGGGATHAAQEAALLMALSRYNTGTPFRGILNGYVATVLRNAGDEGGMAAIPALLPSAPVSLASNAPPAWNVSAIGANAEQHGASWIIDLLPSSSPVGVSSTAKLANTRPALAAASSGPATLSTPPATR